MDPKSTISANIRSALEGKSSLAISRGTGIPERSVQRYRTGARLPKVEHLPRLAAYAQVSVADFFVGVA